MNDPDFHVLSRSERRLGKFITTDKFNETYRLWLVDQTSAIGVAPPVLEASVSKDANGSVAPTAAVTGRTE